MVSIDVYGNAKVRNALVSSRLHINKKPQQRDAFTVSFGMRSNSANTESLVR